MYVRLIGTRLGMTGFSAKGFRKGGEGERGREGSLEHFDLGGNSEPGNARNNSGKKKEGGENAQFCWVLVLHLFSPSHTFFVSPSFLFSFFLPFHYSLSFSYLIQQASEHLFKITGTKNMEWKYIERICNLDSWSSKSVRATDITMYLIY